MIWPLRLLRVPSERSGQVRGKLIVSNHLLLFAALFNQLLFYRTDSNQSVWKWQCFLFVLDLTATCNDIRMRDIKDINKEWFCTIFSRFHLEKWYWWTYLQGRNRNEDKKSRLDTVGGGEGGLNWKSSIETYTLPYVKQIANGKMLYKTRVQPSSLWQCREVGWGEWEGGSRGKGHMYTYGWFMLWYSRSQYNTVKQLSSDKKEWFRINFWLFKPSQREKTEFLKTHYSKP